MSQKIMIGVASFVLPVLSESEPKSNAGKNILCGELASTVIDNQRRASMSSVPGISKSARQCRDKYLNVYLSGKGTIFLGLS